MSAARFAFGAFPCAALKRPLAAPERQHVAERLGQLLAFHRTLASWPLVEKMPDATPFVSIYRRGALVGCFGSADPDRDRRLPRAFLRAVHDPRFGGLRDEDAPLLQAQVSFARSPRLVNPMSVEDEIEVGLHGLALVPRDRPPVVLLPDVAWDEGLGPRALVEALRRKAGLDADDAEGALYLFETERVVAGAVPSRDPPLAVARAWLASLVNPDGSILFSVDPRSGTRTATGPMMHGRAAVAIRALAGSRNHKSDVERARGWLGDTIRAALDGANVEGWPAEPAAVAGTLALALQAGVAVEAQLTAFVKAHHGAITREPWHAAQVVAARPQTAELLFAACVADLERRPWAPWTALAAQACGDRAVSARAARVVADSLRPSAPHRGGASATAIPEVALTALSVEALRDVTSPWARAAVKRGQGFLSRLQLLGPRLHAGLSPYLARGAYPASPIADVLRCDITGHAVLAVA